MSTEWQIRWLAQLQRVQDLLSQTHRLSLVVLDGDCTELTVPSGLPADCGSAAPQEASRCWRMRREAIGRVRTSRQVEALSCPRGRACFVSPLGVGPNDYETPCCYFLAGSGPPQTAAATQLVQELFRLVGPAQPSPRALTHRVDPLSHPPPERSHLTPNLLTPREEEILGLIGIGLTNREISDRLFISQSTVKTHITHLLQKLGLNNRTEAALYAMRESILPVPSAGEPIAKQR